MLILLAAFLALQQPVDPNATCMGCHRPEEKDWKDSVHARVSISCTDCHGNDAADGSKPKGRQHARGKEFLPGTKKINVEMCAKCHGGVADVFKKSAHFEDTQDAEGKVKGCLSCHAPHATTAADRRFIEKESCAKCHKPAARMRKLMEAYCAQAGSLETEMEKLKGWLSKDRPGISPKAEKETHEDALRQLRKIRTLQHGAEDSIYKAIEEETGPRIKETMDAYSKGVSKEREFAKRIPLLFAFLGVLAVNLFLVRTWLKRRSPAA